MFQKIRIFLCLLALFYLFCGTTQAKEGLKNPGTFTLTDFQKYTSLYVLSDAHGMAQSTFAALKRAKIINQANQWSAGKSILLILGDSIDKGPDSIGILDLWIRLEIEARAAGGLVIPLLGNHEAEFLADPNNKKAKEFLEELEKKKIPVSELTNPNTVRGDFFSRMVLGAKLGKTVFIHAGLYPNLSWGEFTQKASSVLNNRDYGNDFLLNDDSVLQAKDWWKKKSKREDQINRLQKFGFWGFVQGHQPKAYRIDYKVGSIEEGRFIKIDCGVAPEAGANALEILHLDNLEDLTKEAMPRFTVIDKNGRENKLIPEEYKSTEDEIEREFE